MSIMSVSFILTRWTQKFKNMWTSPALIYVTSGRQYSVLVNKWEPGPYTHKLTCDSQNTLVNKPSIVFDITS